MWRKIIASLLGVAGVADASAQGYAAGTTAAERAQLPKYCWPQYIDAKVAAQPGYAIPSNCGEYMNHLCPGMIFLIRAQKLGDPPYVRKQNAAHALVDFKYTMQYMTPECSLRAEVEAAMLRAKSIAPDAK